MKKCVDCEKETMTPRLSYCEECFEKKLKAKVEEL